MIKKRHKKGKIKINSKKKIIDDIKFDSSLEAFAYSELKKEGLYGEDKLTHQSKTFVIVDPFEFDGKKYQNIKITPDFVDEKNQVVFEVKGIPNELFPMRWKLMKRYFSLNYPNYKVFIGMKNQKLVIEEIKKIKEYYGI